MKYFTFWFILFWVVDLLMAASCWYFNISLLHVSGPIFLTFFCLYNFVGFLILTNED